MIGVPINEPLPAWRYWLVRPWLKFWTGLFLRAGLGFWPRFNGWENYRKAQDARCRTAYSITLDMPHSMHCPPQWGSSSEFVSLRSPLLHLSAASPMCLHDEAGGQVPSV